ncbi:MAG: hypothetical protein KDD94_02715 [Calditrichaeota bacterium]|nr:hypothetical protein [Calditrichota bacterium]
MLNSFIALFLISFLSAQVEYENDVKSVNNLLKAYYDTVSGPKEKKRDWARLKNLFHPDAKLIYSYWTKEHKNELLQMTVDEYISKLGYTETKGFFENELYTDIKTFSSVIHVASTYEFKLGDNSAQGKGFSSYQLLYDGNRYFIVSMFWQMENENDKLPEEYITKQPQF